MTRRERQVRVILGMAAALASIITGGLLLGSERYASIGILMILTTGSLIIYFIQPIDREILEEQGAVHVTPSELRNGIPSRMYRQVHKASLSAFFIFYTLIGINLLAGHNLWNECLGGVLLFSLAMYVVLRKKRTHDSAIS
jgi:hypothetical protein